MMRESSTHERKASLKQWTCRLHLDSDSLCDAVLHLFKQLWPTYYRTSAIVIGSVRARERLCLCLWECLNREKSPRPLAHLCQIFKVTQNKVQKELRQCRLSPTPVAPSDYLPTLCQCLQIPFGAEALIMKYIQRVEWHSELVVFETNVLIAACVSFISTKLCAVDDTFSPISLSTLHRELDIATRRDEDKVKRLVDRLPNVDIVPFRSSPPPPPQKTLSRRKKTNVLRYCLRWRYTVFDEATDGQNGLTPSSSCLPLEAS